MTDQIGGIRARAHINVANVIRLANERNSRNETTPLVNTPTKEMTAGIEMIGMIETIEINAETKGKETDVDIEITTISRTTTGIVQSVQIQISVFVRIATNVMPPAQVEEENQNREMMDRETVGINKKTTHTMTGIVQSVQIQISVSVKIATNVMPHGLALLATTGKGQIDVMVQMTEVEVTLVEMMEDEAVNVQTIDTEEALEEMMEDKVANVQIKEVENHLHNTANREVKVRTMHIIDPQRK